MELAPHGISVTFDDVRIIVLLLYCVGTVEISPQKVESLLLIAQIMVRSTVFLRYPKMGFLDLFYYFRAFLH